MPKKHEHVGLIEVRSIQGIPFGKDRVTAFVKLFLLDVDKKMKKVHASYGPFSSKDELEGFAAIHSLPITYDLTGV